MKKPISTLLLCAVSAGCAVLPSEASEASEASETSERQGQALEGTATTRAPSEADVTASIAGEWDAKAPEDRHGSVVMKSMLLRNDGTFVGVDESRSYTEGTWRVDVSPPGMRLVLSTANAFGPVTHGFGLEIVGTSQIRLRSPFETTEMDRQDESLATAPLMGRLIGTYVYVSGDAPPMRTITLQKNGAYTTTGGTDQKGDGITHGRWSLSMRRHLRSGFLAVLTLNPQKDFVIGLPERFGVELPDATTLELSGTDGLYTFARR